MKASENQFPSVTLQEVATDGSDLTNPAADHRRLFLGEDGTLHLRDSAGNVTAVSGGIADQGAFTYLDATEAAAPGTPASGKVRLYAKSDGLLYSKDDAGLETVVTGAGAAGGGWGIDADKYHPDNETPATTPAVAMEFNGSIGSWAWTPSSPTVSLTAQPGRYYIEQGNTERYLTLAWVPGATDITLAMKINASTPSQSDVPIWLGVTDATGIGTDAVYMGFQTKSAGSSWEAQFYNRNGGGWSAIVTTQGIGGFTNAINQVYYRLTRAVSGPVWTASYSMDGILWLPLSTTGSKSLTIGAITLRIGPVASGTGYYSIDWIRAWSSIVTHVGA